MPTNKNAKKEKKGMSKGAMIGIGAGVLAAAAATYLLAGPDGKKNRAKLKGWMGDMKNDVAKKMQQAKHITENAYHKIVDTAASVYAKEGVSKEAVAAFAGELKQQWKGFADNHGMPMSKASARAMGKQMAKKVAAKAKKVGGSVAKKMVKKASKKASKKAAKKSSR